jgi:hypothetical protein
MRNPSRDNQTQTRHKPDTEQTNARARGGGVSRSRVSVNPWKPDQDSGLPPWSERRRELFDWADRNLPDQHPGLVVVAILAIRLGGVKPTKELVLERLRATGREASQIGYGPGGYAA